MKRGQIRQGDVLLEPVEGMTPPESAIVSPEVILALGEVTGHAHRLRGTTVYEWSVGGERYVRVGGDRPGTIAHEDHDPIPAAIVVPETTYRVIQQREWDLSQQWKRVLD